MRSLDDPLEWFIIDWEDAVLAPGKAEPHFKQSTHSPHVFIEGHGTEVDVWGVGGLIIDCNALDISSQLNGLGRWMQGSSTPSAREALDRIKEYMSSLVCPELHTFGPYISPDTAEYARNYAVVVFFRSVLPSSPSNASGNLSFFSSLYRV